MILLVAALLSPGQPTFPREVRGTPRALPNNSGCPWSPQLVVAMNCIERRVTLPTRRCSCASSPRSAQAPTMLSSNFGRRHGRNIHPLVTTWLPKSNRLFRGVCCIVNSTSWLCVGGSDKCWSLHRFQMLAPHDDEVPLLLQRCYRLRCKVIRLLGRTRRRCLAGQVAERQQRTSDVC